MIPFSASAHAEFREAEVRHQWAEELYGLIDQASREGARGWILDLRGNGGGYLGPMLAGAQPLLGEGKLLELRGPDAKNTYSIKHGAVLNHFGFAQTSVEESLPLSTPVPRLHRQPVAILIDHATASGAESLAIAFRGRPHTIFIGEPTSGLTSSGTYWDLPDGAVLSIMSQQVYDRRGQSYPEGIQPDLKVADPASIPVISADPSVVAAQDWLANQP